MKTNASNTTLHTLLLLTGINVYCQAPPEPGDETPPDGPINENINMLLLIALLFGIYIIYKHVQKNKKPI
ncbi:hypothetical protein [Flavobacterium laiguense]|uniref:Uncharacterized protein n=1 Tax=Flavobacterium laiguense TaxID=2169409 RepID=A0A2U1K1H9_9FLAO|nr:hypothetical protein [Flavobacterium laiguense]PWA11347.1 hypothetical protein DB891_00595 [Flavobacterium laiguense]